MKPDAYKRFKSAATLFLVVGLAASAVGLGYLFLSPKIWQATAKVRVEARGWVHSEGVGARTTLSSEAPYMDAERQFMRSDELLGRVIENLRLREVWGRKLQPGALMGTNQTLRLLHARTSIRVVPRTSVLEVQVTGDDPVEIAPIANEIARLYCDYRQSQRKAASEEKIAALQTQWEKENTKLSQAQEQLEKIVLDIKKARAASADSLYGPEEIQRMQNDRNRLETAFIQQRDQLEQFKALKPDQLKVLLPTVLTNDALNTSLERLAEARRTLAEERTKSGAETEETKRAAALADEADTRVNQAIVGVISEREADLAMRKSMLEKLNTLLKNARTNVDELSQDNPGYVAAQQRVQQIEEEREQLRDRLTGSDSLEAYSPFSLSAQIYDNAETPTRPVSPDQRLALGIIIVGTAVCCGSLLLFWMAARTKPVPKPAPAPLPFSKVRHN